MINIRKLEAELWESADLLRAGSKLTSNQYCMPVLGLIFLRYAYSRFKLVEAEILKDRPVRGGHVLPVEASDFVSRSALFLPREAQYAYLVNLPENIAAAGLTNWRGEVMGSLGEAVNNAMELVEQQSEQLSGVLPKTYTMFSDELLAELARLARVGEVHDGVGAKVLGDLDLLPFLGGIGLVARDAQVHVDLGGQALTDAKGAHAFFDVHDVGRNGDAAVGHALADVLGVAMLALGDLLHLRCDLPGAGEVDLRDELGLGLCAHWHGSLRWHYPYQVCGSGRARPISACRLVLQAPRLCNGLKYSSNGYDWPNERACGEANMEDKHLYRETQWDVSAEESRAHHGLVAIGFAVLAVLVIAFCIWTFGGRGGAAWEFEADDSLPIMTVRSTGGNANTLAVPGDYWYPCDEFVQLQLSGGSIPGEEIERVTYDATFKTLTVKLKDQGDVPTTMDIALTEWRLEPPSGVAVSEVEHVKIVYQDGSTNGIAKADGLAE